MVGAVSDAYNYIGVRKSVVYILLYYYLYPIFIPDGRNCDPSFYQTAEIETHSLSLYPYI